MFFDGVNDPTPTVIALARALEVAEEFLSMPR